MRRSSVLCRNPIIFEKRTMKLPEKEHFQPYAKYQFWPKTYWAHPRYRTRTRYMGLDTDHLRIPGLPEKMQRGKWYTDDHTDMTKKEWLKDTEWMRNEIEFDFYQDHTYHNQWFQRELEDDQKKQIIDAYKFMDPAYRILPWLWYPGDTVEVIAGEFQGQRGQIMACMAYKNQIMVQNINVQTMSIPATEDRPAQDLQREHPIDVKLVKHVDPTTQELCDVKVVSVRNKETGKIERRRISLASGTVLPIPKEDVNIEGDPLRDTPMLDAEEPTYDEEKELKTLVERKLQAMENGFIERLKASYEFHHEHAVENANDMKRFQADVMDRAEELALAALDGDDGSVSFVDDDEGATQASQQQ